MSGVAPRGGLAFRLGLLATVVCAPIAACQAFISADSYFDPGGVTYLAQYSNLDPPPNQLTITPAGLFYAQGDNIWVVPTDGSSPPAVVHSFTGPPTSLQFDGSNTLFACDPMGAVFAANVDTLAPAPAPVLPGACLSVAASQDILVTAAVGDGGITGDGADASVPLSFGVVVRSDGGLTEHPEVSLSTVDITLAAQDFRWYASLAYGEVRQFAPAVGGGTEVCRLLIAGDTSRPKMLVLPSTPGAPLLLVRGENDDIHMVDADEPCCEDMACEIARGRSQPLVQPGRAGDFTLAGPYVYWSSANMVQRQLLSDIDSLGAHARVVSLSDPSAVITALAADAQAVYFVVGSALLRAPLPASPGDP